MTFVDETTPKRYWHRLNLMLPCLQHSARQNGCVKGGGFTAVRWSTAHRCVATLSPLLAGVNRAYNVIDAYAKRFPKVVQCLEDGLEDSPAFYAFPKLDARKILSFDSNMIE